MIWRASFEHNLQNPDLLNFRVSTITYVFLNWSLKIIIAGVVEGLQNSQDRTCFHGAGIYILLFVLFERYAPTIRAKLLDWDLWGGVGEGHYTLVLVYISIVVFVA